jgi:hypothetical protein
MSDLILYTTEDGKTQIDLRLQDGTVWLTQLQIAELFQATKQNISLHLINIFEDGELNQEATVKESLTVQTEGNYVRELDSILKSTGRRLLDNAGTVSTTWAQEKAKRELQRYKAITLDQVETDYLKTISSLEKKAKKESRKKGDKHE